MAVQSLPFTSRLDNEIEVLEKKFEKASERIRVASPGIIKSFDPVKQVVTVQIAIREKVSAAGRPYEDKTIPILAEVPIYMPRAGNFVLTMPVTIGDECLVIFSDCCYDAWWESGAVGNQMDNRRHDLSDGFAILGPWSQPNIVSDYSQTSAVLRNLANDSYVEVRDTTINIVTTNKVTVDAPSVEIKTNSMKENVQHTSTETVGMSKTITATNAINLVAPSVTSSGNLKVSGAVEAGIGATGVIVGINGTATVTKGIITSIV
jgi:hypothetical protein